ncbi:hypothetical protein ACQPWY_02345 [Pseudonocardia xinjiangensis]|uniref:hypothetical protein n=1 Tax=Pseudonocardia xinjiangensis TaxID=75289 RepID=UPI003D8E709B
MRTLFSGDIRVSYSQASVDGVDGWRISDLASCFAGQVNGLCGAAEPGGLFLITGLHTGQVPFVVEEHDGPPPVGEEWEEVVEVGFVADSSATALVGWAGATFQPLGLAPGVYRVRYCASGIDAGKAADTSRADAPAPDRYLLQFWPSAARPDQVLRQTAEVARYWHDYAQSLDPAQVRAERAEADRRRHPEAERSRQQHEALLWRGARPPGPLGEIPSARTLVLLDRALAEAVAAAGAPRQRALARWAARRAFAEAGLDEIVWIAPALAALDSGQTLPAPFDDVEASWQALWADEHVRYRAVSPADGQGPDRLQQAVAFPALAAATHPDPTVAVFDVLHHATAAFGSPRLAVLFDDVRRHLDTSSNW